MYKCLCSLRLPGGDRVAWALGVSSRVSHTACHAFLSGVSLGAHREWGEAGWIVFVVEISVHFLTDSVCVMGHGRSMCCWKKTTVRFFPGLITWSASCPDLW